MNLRKGNIAIKAVTIALMAMVISFCVPHHHHKEAICIGNYDCKGEQKHSHHDDCGGEDSRETCSLIGSYVDSRHVNDNFVPPVLDNDGLAAIIYKLIVYELDNGEGRVIVYWQPSYAAPLLSFKPQRGPPAC